jgi:hypothetical protein
MTGEKNVKFGGSIHKDTIGIWAHGENGERLTIKMQGIRFFIIKNFSK